MKTAESPGAVLEAEDMRFLRFGFGLGAEFHTSTLAVFLDLVFRLATPYGVPSCCMRVDDVDKLRTRR
jgi:hypothetical protein